MLFFREIQQPEHHRQILQHIQTNNWIYIVPNIQISTN